MSSDFFFLDGSCHHHSSPEMVSTDSDFFFSDPFSSLGESPFVILQELSNNHNTQCPVQNSSYLDTFSPNNFSSSPPSHQLENLTLYQTTQLQPLSNGSNLANGYGNFSGLDTLVVKTEECQLGYDHSYNNQSFMPHSYSGVENVTKIMQRSYSSSSFDGSKPGFLFQPRFDTVLESPNYQAQALSSPENSFLSGHLRRVCSTGDLRNTRTAHATHTSFSNPLATESSLMEETNFKVGRYSAEERKERISKYRAKRNQRNFAKTIKYACRKTLADNRTRIRGRFARNDEIGEIPKAACFSRDEDEEELWFDGLHEEEVDRTMRGVGAGAGAGAFVNSFGKPRFQYYGYNIVDS